MKWLWIFLLYRAVSFADAVNLKGLRSLNFDVGLQRQESSLARNLISLQRRGNTMARPFSFRKKPAEPHTTSGSASIKGPGILQRVSSGDQLQTSTFHAGQSGHLETSSATTSHIAGKTFRLEPGHVPDQSYPLKVQTSGRQVQALVHVPEGGQGHVELHGDSGYRKIRVKQGTIGGGQAVSETAGGAKAVGRVTRGGEAQAWSIRRRSNSYIAAEDRRPE